MAAFTGALATRIVQLPPNDLESKGIVERVNGYLETSFLPGRVFTCPADFNAQLAASHQRSWARRQTISDPTHVMTAARLRAAYQHAAASRSAAGRDDGQTGLVRDLADYDARFGIDFTIDGPDTTHLDVAGQVTG